MTSDRPQYHGFLKERDGPWRFDRVTDGTVVEVAAWIYVRRARSAFRKWKIETGSDLRVEVSPLIDTGRRCFWTLTFYREKISQPWPGEW